ncbi:hypothetical protein GYH30_042499 [Glycine max]|uniref:Uncharacterized protein n=1 Tax=Glycine max TaxID=3847 RepID=A0A0R0G1I9_SOYBN|nr:hypothetical protein GYH30_042499 [Glycine max]
MFCLILLGIYCVPVFVSDSCTFIIVSYLCHVFYPRFLLKNSKLFTSQLQEPRMSVHPFSVKLFYSGVDNFSSRSHKF